MARKQIVIIAKHENGDITKWFPVSQKAAARKLSLLCDPDTGFVKIIVKEK